VPDEIHQVPAIPRTLSGKKLEVPVRKIMLGTDPEQAADPNALADPAALQYFGRYRPRLHKGKPRRNRVADLRVPAVPAAATGSRGHRHPHRFVSARQINLPGSRS